MAMEGTGNGGSSGGVRLEALRSLDDFMKGSARFALPTGDLERWGRRLKNNLIYYQTNYFVLMLIMFLIVAVMRPSEVFQGAMFVTVLGIVGFIVAQDPVQARNWINTKKPIVGAVSFVILAYAYYIYEEIFIFGFAVALPLLIVFIHASLRLRNLKSKVMNTLDKAGIKKTPMGLILDRLGLVFEGLEE